MPRTPSKSLAYRLGRLETELELASQLASKAITRLMWQTASDAVDRSILFMDEANEILDQYGTKITPTALEYARKIRDHVELVNVTRGRLLVFLDIYKATAGGDIPPNGWSPILASGTVTLFSPASEAKS